jgi:hypothetical protein
MSKNIRQQGMPSAGSPLFLRACHEVIDEALGRKGGLLNQFVTLIQAIKLGLVLVDADNNIVNRDPVKMTSRELNSYKTYTGVGTTELFRTKKLSITGSRPLFVFMVAYMSWTHTTAYPVITRCEDGTVVASGATDPDAAGNTAWYSVDPGDRIPVAIAGIDEPGNGNWSYKMELTSGGSGDIGLGLRRGFVSEWEDSQFSSFEA